MLDIFVDDAEARASYEGFTGEQNEGFTSLRDTVTYIRRKAEPSSTFVSVNVRPDGTRYEYPVSQVTSSDTGILDTSESASSAAASSAFSSTAAVSQLSVAVPIPVHFHSVN